ncbi:FAD-dependent oxidoreductase [Natranaerobius trueperi]|uniref:FAD-dependent oxidoreductase n=1 Tax=Natranaerobius trueperi TaxID=759412 RepID=UPI0023E35C2C|nr:FAD-dependent oxidoreductase [Natranaerobius trueperi]
MGCGTDDVTTEEFESDVVVVGGGGAGLAAAVSAAEEGVDVTLLEKMPAVHEDARRDVLADAVFEQYGGMYYMD